MCLRQQILQSDRLYDIVVRQQFQPVDRFIGLLYDHPELGYKLAARPRSASCPVICSNRSAGPQQLLTNYLCFRTSRQSTEEPDDTICKLFCSAS